MDGNEAFKLVVFGAAGLLAAWFAIVLLLRRGDPAAIAAAPAGDGAYLDRDAGTKAASALKQADPAFDEARFLERCRALHAALEGALASGDFTAVEPWVADGLLHGHTTLAAMQTGARPPRSLAAVRLVGHELAERHQCLQVELLERSAGGDFTSVWNFARRVGATSRAGLLEGKCPQCGAALALNAQRRCGHCEAVVSSGEYDWVLASASLGSDRLRRKPHAVDLCGLLAADPALTSRALECRATLVFWRWVQSQAAQRPQLFAQVSAKDATAPVEPLFAQRAAFPRLHSTNLLAFSEQEGRHRAHLELQWTLESPQGLLRSVREVVVLDRAAAARTPERLGLSAARCIACLGPLDASGQAACPWCGKDVHDDWVLQAIEPHLSWSQWFLIERRRVLSGGEAGADAVTAQEASPEDVLRMLTAIALADGELDDREREHLKVRAEEWGISRDRAGRILAEARAVDVDRLPGGSREANRLIDEAIAVTLLDGTLDQRDRNRLQRLARHLRVLPHLEKRLTLMVLGSNGQNGVAPGPRR